MCQRAPKHKSNVIVFCFCDPLRSSEEKKSFFYNITSKIIPFVDIYPFLVTFCCVLMGLLFSLFYIIRRKGRVEQGIVKTGDELEIIGIRETKKLSLIHI